jgi:hypothetical protein
MATETLAPERILEAAEEVLRRYGPAKANVVDPAHDGKGYLGARGDDPRRRVRGRPGTDRRASGR